MKIRQTLYRVKWKISDKIYYDGKCIPYGIAKNIAYIMNCISVKGDYFVEKIEVPENENEDLIFTLEKP